MNYYNQSDAIGKKDARTLLCALVSDGIDVSKLTPLGRQELRDAIDVLLRLVNQE